MATIRQKGVGQWHAQIRKKGFPPQTKTFRTEAEAKAWATTIEADMIRGVHVDRSPAERETFADIIDRYLKEVTDKRPGEASRIAERARLERFLREEKALCSYAVAHLTYEHFEQWRDRRLMESPSRGKEGGRGRYKAVEHVVKLRANGTPRANAAKPKAPPKPTKTISPGTVKRELTLLKRVWDHSRKRLKLLENPISTDNVARPAVNDERDVRLDHGGIDLLLKECYAAENPFVGPLVEVAFESGSRRGNLLRLLWKDVDLAKRTAILRRVKNSRRPDEVRDIRIGLTPRAVEVLSSLPTTQDEPRVFPISVSLIASAFKRARARAKVGHFRLHDARHERTSSLIEAGWSDTEVMAQTGHLDHKSLKRYANLRESFLADKLAALPSRARREGQCRVPSSRAAESSLAISAAFSSASGSSARFKP
jgi:integrase